MTLFWCHINIRVEIRQFCIYFEFSLINWLFKRDSKWCTFECMKVYLYIKSIVKYDAYIKWINKAASISSQNYPPMSSSTIWASIGQAENWQLYAAIRPSGHSPKKQKNGSRKMYSISNEHQLGKSSGHGQSSATSSQLAPLIRISESTN